jgi:hypothetical protein
MPGSVEPDPIAVRYDIDPIRVRSQFMSAELHHCSPVSLPHIHCSRANHHRAILIDPNNNMSTIQWLAAPERKGRGSQTPELIESAKYIANQFKNYGLVPAPYANQNLDGIGMYFQEFPFVDAYYQKPMDVRPVDNANLEVYPVPDLPKLKDPQDPIFWYDPFI